MEVSDVCIYDIGKALSEVEEAWSWLDSAQRRVEKFDYLLREYELEKAYKDKEWVEARSTLIALDEDGVFSKEVLNKIAWFVKYLGRKAIGRE